MKNTFRFIIDLRIWNNRRRKVRISLIIILLLFILSSCNTSTVTPPNSKESVINEKRTVSDTDHETIGNTEDILEVPTMNEELKIHFIDVGQADSILIQDPSGKNMLIDAGNNEDSSLVVNYLNDMQIRKIDVLVGTHPHEDHIGGLDSVINHFSIGDIYMPKISHTTNTFKDVLLSIKNNGYKILTPSSGSEFELGSSTYSILSPISSSYSDLNNYSITMKLQYGNNSFIFMGDAEELVENEILKKGYNVKSDLIKIGHHGSSYSSSTSFMKEVDPKYAIITVGENSYGHPHVETLTLLKNNGIKVYRTDEDGTIVVTSDGKNITIDKNASSIRINAPPTNNEKMKSIATNTMKDIVYTTKTGTKYHNYGCSYLNISKISIIKDDAITKGLTPCSKCH